MACQPVSAQLRLDESNLPDFLRRIGLFGPLPQVRVEPAGDGNINWVRRVSTPNRDRSWIVKQARPALERFPEYRVSTERIVFEARYYEVVAAFDDRGICPRVIHFDEAQRVLILEDLGDAERLDAALARGADAARAAADLGGFLGAVHAGTSGLDLAGRFANDAMRRLHGDHIFALPLAENDFPLSPALRAEADALRARPELAATAAELYRRYLGPGTALVHADVQAGNVLLTPERPKLLDAEIAHLGDPAFDVGTLVAHLLLPGAAAGRLAGAIPAAEAAWSEYLGRRGARGAPAFAEVARYAGIEMLRRTIGAARVAAVASDGAARAALRTALRLLLDPPDRPAAIA